MEILAISVMQRGFSGKQRILGNGWGTEDLICIENATDFFVVRSLHKTTMLDSTTLKIMRAFCSACAQNRPRKKLWVVNATKF